jgi:hypothetical protein
VVRRDCAVDFIDIEQAGKESHWPPCKDTTGDLAGIPGFSVPLKNSVGTLAVRSANF